MMTKNEFIARSGIPRQTLERWLRAGKIVPADFDDNNKPLFSDEQISAAKALHKPEHNPKKSVTAADRAQSAISTDNTHDNAQHVAQIEIDRATFNTIMLHAEKIENGQADFVATLQRELNALTAAAPVFATADNLRDRVRNFLSQLSLIIRDDDRRYRLTKLAPNSFELDLIDATADDTQHVVEGEVSTDKPQVEHAANADELIDNPVDKFNTESITQAADDVPTFEIDAEFRDLCPPLTDDEFNLLEANILRDGIQDPIKIWRGVIVDGHNRYSIAQKHGLTFATVEMHFADRDDAIIWIITNQSGRRNLSAYDRARLALKLKPVFSSKAKIRQGSRTDFYQKSDKSCPPSNTLGELAKIAGVSHDTIHKVEIIEAEASPEIKANIRAGVLSINAAYKKIRPAKKKTEPPAESTPDVQLTTAPTEPTRRRNQIAGIDTYGGFDDDDDPNSENPDFNTSENADINPPEFSDADTNADGTQPDSSPADDEDDDDTDDDITADPKFSDAQRALRRVIDCLTRAANNAPYLKEFFKELCDMCLKETGKVLSAEQADIRYRRRAKKLSTSLPTRRQ